MRTRSSMRGMRSRTSVERCSKTWKFLHFEQRIRSFEHRKGVFLLLVLPKNSYYLYFGLPSSTLHSLLLRQSMTISSSLTPIPFNLANQMDDRYTVRFYIWIYERQVGPGWCHQNDFFDVGTFRGVVCEEFPSAQFRLRSIALFSQPHSIDDLRATYPTWTFVGPGATPSMIETIEEVFHLSRSQVSPRRLVFDHPARNREGEHQECLRYFGWLHLQRDAPTGNELGLNRRLPYADVPPDPHNCLSFLCDCTELYAENCMQCISDDDF